MRVAHIAAGRVMQLGLLQMKLRGRKAVKRPGVVVMHVGQDHVFDGAGIDTDER